MDVKHSTTSKSPIRVLFLAWGYSIHAERRIKIFIDDPFFQVAVVSTYDYGFKNAVNIQLTDAILKRAKTLNTGGCQNNKENTSDDGIFISRFKKSFKTLISHFVPGIVLTIAHDLKKCLKDIKILQSSVNDFSPHVIFLQTLLYPCYLSYFLNRKIPKIITFWNGDVIWWAQNTGIEKILKKRIVQYGSKTAAAITVNSKSAFNACLDYGADEKNIHLIRYPGVELKKFYPVLKEKARKKTGIKSRHVVLCPRGIGGYLNSDVIVEAVPRVIEKYPDVLFLFISDVGMKDYLECHQKRAEELGIEKYIIWNGRVEWELMPEYYNSSDVVVSISSNDSLPNCMVEAMACGIPVIMGDIPQIRDWIIDGTNGFLIDPRDPDDLAKKIIEMLNDNGKASRFIKYNIDVVHREMDSEKNITKVKEIICKVGQEFIQEKVIV